MIVADIILIGQALHEAAPGRPPRSLSPLEAALLCCYVILILLLYYYYFILGHISLACMLGLFVFVSPNLSMSVRTWSRLCATPSEGKNVKFYCGTTAAQDA